MTLHTYSLIFVNSIKLSDFFVNQVKRILDVPFVQHYQKYKRKEVRINGSDFAKTNLIS